MTRLPTPLHRPYSRARREYGPWSIPGLRARWPISGGRQFTDSGATIHAGADDPVGFFDDVLGGIDLVQATTSKKPTLDADGPALAFDGVDDLLQTTYALDPSYRWAIAMVLFSKDGSDSIALDELDGVTNLAGEFAMRINAGDNRQVTMLGNWDPN
ncbi:MAG: hypothetical protein K0A98_14230, partial [Trueperaceae bacterium]|nr:hypothetical protein [Trueperaceae bacterium]